MRVHIPQHVIGRAILAAGDSREEAVGFFVINPGKIHVHGHTQGEGGATRTDPYVEWYHCTNIHPKPFTHSEVAAEEMDYMINERKLVPIALFHSHPSGNPDPSVGDQEGFPIHYVDTAFIWTHSFPTFLTQYSSTGLVKSVRVNEVFLDAVTV